MPSSTHPIRLAIVGVGARAGVDMGWGTVPVFGHFGLDLVGANGGAIRIEPGLTDTVRNNSAHYYLFTADGRSIEEQLVREGLTLIWIQDGEHMDGSSSGTPGLETLRPGACGRGIKRF